MTGRVGSGNAGPPASGWQHRATSRVGLIGAGVIALGLTLVYYFAVYLPRERASSHERNQRVLADITHRVESAFANLPNLLQNPLRSRARADPTLRYCDVERQFRGYSGMRRHGVEEGQCALDREPVEVSLESGGGPDGAGVVRYEVAWTTGSGSRGAPRLHESSFLVDIHIAEYLRSLSLDDAELFDGLVVVRGASEDEPSQYVYWDRQGAPLPLRPEHLMAAVAPQARESEGALDQRAHVGELQIGPSNYWVYGQPLISEVLGRAPPWQVFALMERRTLDAQIHKLPLQEILLVVTLFAVVVLSAPHLKLLVVGRREMLRSADIHALLLAAALGVAVATLVAAGLTLRAELTESLELVGEREADRVAQRLEDHVSKVAVVLNRFAKGARARLGSLTWGGERCLPVSSEGASREGFIQDPEIPWGPSLNHERPCLLDHTTPVEECEVDYYQIIWVASDGWQLGKIASDEDFLTPLIRVQNRPYFRETAAGKFNAFAPASVTSGHLHRVGEERWGLNIHVVKSRNTGHTTWAFSALLADESLRYEVGPVVQLTTGPEKIFQDLRVPVEMQYAVVDGNGDVLMHSDAYRALSENLLRESDDDPELRARLHGRRSDEVTIAYHQKPTDVYLRPIRGTELFAVVLVDRDLLSVTLAEVMLRAGTLCGWVMLVGSVLGLALMLGGQANGRAWLWPPIDGAHRQLVSVASLLTLALAQWKLCDHYFGRCGLALMLLVPLLALSACHQSLSSGCGSLTRRVGGGLLTGTLVLIVGLVHFRWTEGTLQPEQLCGGWLLLLGGALPFGARFVEVRERGWLRSASYVASGTLLLVNVAVLPAYAAVQDSERLAAQTWAAWKPAGAADDETDPEEAECTEAGLARAAGVQPAMQAPHPAGPCYTTSLALPLLGDSKTSERLALSAWLVSQASFDESDSCGPFRNLSHQWPVPTSGASLEVTSSAPEAAGAPGRWSPWPASEPEEAAMLSVWALVFLFAAGEVWLIAVRVFGLRSPSGAGLRSATPWRTDDDSPYVLCLFAPPAAKRRLLEQAGVRVLEPTCFTTGRASEFVEPNTHVVVMDLESILFHPVAASGLVRALGAWTRTRGLRVTLFAERDPEELLTAVDAHGKPLVRLEGRDLEALSQSLFRFRRTMPLVGGPASALRRSLCAISGLSERWQDELVRQFAFDVELHTTACGLGREIARDGVKCSPENLQRMAEGAESRIGPRLRRAWHRCSGDEQFVLAHVAKEGFVNPNTWDVVAQLEYRGLVFRDPAPCVGPRGLVDLARSELGRLNQAAGPEGVRWKGLRAPVMAVALSLLLMVLVLEPVLGGSLLALLTPLATASASVNRVISSVASNRS